MILKLLLPLEEKISFVLYLGNYLCCMLWMRLMILSILVHRTMPYLGFLHVSYILHHMSWNKIPTSSRHSKYNPRLRCCKCNPYNYKNVYGDRPEYWEMVP